MTGSRKSAENARGRPFAKGNAGKPPGTRNRVTLAVEALLEGEAEELTRKAIELAKAGDGPALRLCLERVAPVRRGRPVSFDLPPIAKADDVLTALGALIQAVAGGALTPEEAALIAELLEVKRRALETVELEGRIAALEAKAP